jgi:hypothetical protein
MSKRSGLYPYSTADTASAGVVSQAGGALLVETIRAWSGSTATCQARCAAGAAAGSA